MLSAPGLLRRILPSGWLRSELAERVVLERCRSTVASGPFAGLRYGDGSIGSAHWPKLLGTYEKELHPALEGFCLQGFDALVVVGAAEGYYACGLAQRQPGIPVTAFEADPAGREALRKNLERNELEQQVEIDGRCDVTALRATLDGLSSCLIVIDVEGVEIELLDPPKIPDLVRAHILVEVHDFIDPAIGPELEKRFNDTHALKEVHSRPRSLADLPFQLNPLLRLYCAPALLRLMDEERPGQMRWFLLTPRD